MSFVASSAAGIATSHIVVTVDGVNVSGTLSFTGSSTSWTVNCPITPNAPHTASVQVTDNNSNIASAATFTFDTFSTSYYTWEAEDYDYTSNGVSGLFADNPQVDAYNLLTAASGIDCYESDVNANSFVYRPTNTALVVATSAAGDKAQAQFTRPHGLRHWVFRRRFLVQLYPALSRRNLQCVGPVCRRRRNSRPHLLPN